MRGFYELFKLPKYNLSSFKKAFTSQVMKDVRVLVKADERL
jgi:hypothetical protein